MAVALYGEGRLPGVGVAWTSGAMADAPAQVFGQVSLSESPVVVPGLAPNRSDADPRFSWAL